MCWRDNKVYYPNYERVNPAIINDIARAINGEYSAIACYEYLSSIAPSAEEKNRITEILNDEMRHYQIFNRMYTSLSGKQPTPHLTEKCPSEYMAGIRSSFIDEQKTVDFYMEAADRATDPHIKEQFKRIAVDEQNHAVWFLYFLTQKK